MLFLNASNFKFSALVDSLKKVESGAFNLYLGIVGSLLASVVFVWLQETDESRLEKIRRIANVDFLNTFIGDLRHFKSRTCRDYNVNVKFSPIIDHPELLLVKLRYDYYKNVISRKLAFKIVRTFSEEDPQEKSPNHDDNFFLNECYFKLDERTIAPKPCEELYLIQNLVLSYNYPVSLDSRWSETKGADKITVASKTLECQGIIPSEISLHEEINIAFEVCFPMERESFFAVNYELPTHQSRVFLDYGELDGDIEVVSQSFISPRFGPNDIKRSDSKHTIHLGYDGWLLPKNGIVFCWWKKDKKS
jgi:hypothetical protein